MNIETLHSGSTDPRSIVEYAIKQRREYQISDDDGNEIWCVFDVDENRDEDLKNSISHAQGKGVNIALSNPSFEFWYLLHFIYREAGIDRNEVLEELRRAYLPDYEKEKNYNAILFPFTEKASERAQRLNEFHIEHGNDLDGRNSNPSTQVFRLIHSIDKIKKRNQ